MNTLKRSRNGRVIWDAEAIAFIRETISHPSKDVAEVMGCTVAQIKSQRRHEKVRMESERHLQAKEILAAALVDSEDKALEANHRFKMKCNEVEDLKEELENERVRANALSEAVAEYKPIGFLGLYKRRK